MQTSLTDKLAELPPRHPQHFVWATAGVTLILPTLLVSIMRLSAHSSWLPDDVVWLAGNALGLSPAYVPVIVTIMARRYRAGFSRALIGVAASLVGTAAFVAIVVMLPIAGATSN